MNAELLLTHYERVAEAPDAIQRLRELVLDIAIQGKATNFKGPWRKTTLAELGAWGSGGTPSKSHPEYYGGDIPWLVIGDLNDGIVERSQNSITEAGLANSSAKLIAPGTVLIAMYGSIGKLGIAGIECATNQAIAYCVPAEGIVTRQYLFWLLRSLRKELLGRGQGIAQQNISQKILKAWPVQLPPLAEQHRIVAKVDELMALCDQLETAQADREMDRDKLTLSTLAKLNEPDPETFAADASFALENLKPLTKSADQIKQLRQTILNLAVRGKLVEQDPNDEPASEQLLRIRQAKSASERTRKVAREAKRTDAPDCAVPIPSGWAISTLGELALSMRYGTSIKCERKIEGAPVLRIKQLDNTSVPLPFRCVFAIEVPNDVEVEKLVHAAFASHQVRKGREYFEIDAAHVMAALKLTGGIDVTPKTDIAQDAEGIQALQKAVSRRPPGKLSDAGLKPGDEISYLKNESVKAIVHDDRKIVFEGKITSLSAAAHQLLLKDGYTWQQVNGWNYWLYDGKTLAERLISAAANEVALEEEQSETNPETEITAAGVI